MASDGLIGGYCILSQQEGRQRRLVPSPNDPNADRGGERSSELSSMGPASALATGCPETHAHTIRRHGCFRVARSQGC